MPTVAMIVTVGALIAGGISAASASAKTEPCSPKGNNYYGETCLFGEFHGIAGTIRSYELARKSAKFVDNDMWIVHHNSEPSNWIEAGIIVGYLCEEQEINSGGGGVCYKGEWSNGPRFFWGDHRSGSLYYGHFGNAASLGTAYGDKIYFKGSETWSVEVGSLSGLSTKNPLSANLIRTGTEEADQTAIACSEQYNLKWLNPATNEWHSGWTNSKEEAPLAANKPPFAWWVTKNSWVRDASENSNACY